MQPEVRNIGVQDLNEIIRVHSRAFPDSALTRLGNEAIRRNYVSLLSEQHEVVAIGAFIEDRLAGFCFGGIFRGELSYFLLHNRSFLIRRVLLRPWLVLHPEFCSRIRLALRLLRKPERMVDTPGEAQNPSARSFGIQAIAVDPSVQGKGVGRLLMDATEDAARERGFRRMHLTVHRYNEKAIRFYEGTGWVKEVINGEWNEVMRKPIADAKTEPA